MKKTQRQESVSVSRPPSSSPTAPPPAAIALQIPSALVRSRPSEKVVITIESAAGDQEARGAGKAVDEGGNREDRESGHEQALPAEEVRRAAAEQQEAPEEERVDVDDPLQAGRREMEPVLDRRQRHVHDRRVEHDHELRHAHQNENEPPVYRNAHPINSFL